MEYEREELSPNLFDKIGGLDDEITEVMELLEAALGLTNNNINFKYPRGCLLYGNPGTGKTLMANALAQHAKVNVVHVRIVELYVKHSEGVEDTLRSLFENATTNSPSVIVLDEVDALCPSRTTRTTDLEKRISARVLAFFDDIATTDLKIFAMGVTNKPEAVDVAFRRCGRFDREIEIPTPSPASR